MNGSWHIGKLAGIDVRIHWTFLLLPGWIYFSNLVAGNGFVAATTSVIFVLAIFGCVVLHELGHSLMARRFGIATRDITLLPIGGVASLERMPRNPLLELAIALAGPAVNLVIASAVFGLLIFGAIPVAATLGTSVLFLENLAWVNLALVVFNMIPAFPMDGGRVLRSVLAMLMPYGQATNIAAGVGQFAAVGLGFLGLFSGNLMLVVIAGFVYLAARGEAIAVNLTSQADSSGRYTHDAPYDFREQAIRATQNGSPDWIGNRQQPKPTTRLIVDADWSVQSTFDWLSHQQDSEVPVVKRDQIIGYICKEDLYLAIVSGRGHWPIQRLLSTGFPPPGASHFAR